ncbi:MAG: hypothetical protein MUO82_11965 [Candidatus Thermoplasmatota archaeon]|nr:hypothetical protein [Candidatus Thermoplasmatota archaeon]
MVENNKDNINKKSSSMKRNNRKILSLVIVIIIISSIFLYLNLANYLPFLSETKQPRGNIEPINTQKYIEENPELGEMPNLDKIKCNAWKTNLIVEQVVDSYKQDLSKDGYELQYENTIDYDGKEYYVLGFLKGLTAVGILISLDTTSGDEYNSEVIYTTGNAIDFKEIIDWYQSQ